MGKNLLPWALAGFLAIACLALLDRSCGGPDPAYWVKRAVYDEAVKTRDARLQNALGLIAEKDIELKESDVALAKSAGEVTELRRKAAAGSQTIASQDREIERFKTDAQAAIDANPAVKRLVDAYEEQLANYKSQVFNLSAQIAKLGVPEEAGTDPRTGEKLWVYPQGTITGRLHGQFLAAVAQRDAWRAQYEEEHGLRLESDGLRIGLEKKLCGGKFWKWVALGEPVVFGVISVFGRK